MRWTTRNNSARTVTVQHFAGSSPPQPWGTNTSTTGTVTTAFDQTTTGCNGTTTNVIDEANNVHKNCFDGLGRLTAVTEPSATVTNYTYDLLNNLVGVLVSGQTNNTCTVNSVSQMRCFCYSTLSQIDSEWMTIRLEPARWLLPIVRS